MIPSSLARSERYARAAWSRLAEPADPVAARLVAQLGAVDALDAVVTGGPAVLDRFQPRLRRLDLERDLELAEKVGARVVCPGDEDWPAGLDDLAAPPLCLWVRGSLALSEICRRSVSVVGARAATAYGESTAAEIAAGVAERGFTVVSGAAFGIDAAAHRGALAVSGRTVAVLAGGVDRPYPAAHTALIARIGQEGALVSEAPPGGAPTKSRFLHRNRLIATMTGGTVVVEAALRSGARHTAARAADHHRVVAAVPGPVTSPCSAGCHDLIRSGVAVLVTDAGEVAEAVGDLGRDLTDPRAGCSRSLDGLDETDMRVVDALTRRPRTADDLAARAGVSAATAAAALGRLNLAGFALRTSGGWRLPREKEVPGA